MAAVGGAGGSAACAPFGAPFLPPFPPESDDEAEWQKWTEAVVEQGICRRLGLDIPAKKLLEEWESSYEFMSACKEINSMMSTICDFANGKISVEDAEKRIDDGSYRAAFFRDEYLKKGLHLAKEKEEELSPPLGDTGLEPVTPSLSS